MRNTRLYCPWWGPHAPAHCDGMTSHGVPAAPWSSPSLMGQVWNLCCFRLAVLPWGSPHQLPNHAVCFGMHKMSGSCDVRAGGGHCHILFWFLLKPDLDSDGQSFRKMIKINMTYVGNILSVSHMHWGQCYLTEKFTGCILTLVLPSRGPHFGYSQLKMAMADDYSPDPMIKIKAL